MAWSQKQKKKKKTEKKVFLNHSKAMRQFASCALLWLKNCAIPPKSFCVFPTHILPQKDFNSNVLSNQIKFFHYTRCNMPKRVTNCWWSPRSCHCARVIQLLSKKCRSGGELSATLCLIWQARDLILWPPASVTNALPFGQNIAWYQKKEPI